MFKTQRIRALAALVFLLVAAATNAADSFNRSQLDQALDTLASNQRIRGSVALMKDGKLVYERALGDGVDTQTMLRIGSITKVFTAAMIYQLIEEKKLTLDTKLARFFPQIANAEQITIGQMLAHSSGIANVPNRDEPWMRDAQTRQQMLARFAAAKPEYAPGEKTTYSNAAYVLLGYIIEDVTHSTYAVQLDRRIARKLNLKRTRFGRTVDPKNNEAYSFQWDDDRWTQLPETHWTVPAGAGGIASTAGDLATFIDALFNGNKILRDSSVREMLTGKGINVHTLARIDKKAYSHLGGVDGFSSNLLYFPDDRLVVAIIMNGQNYPMNKLFWTLVDNYFGRPFTPPSFTAKPLPAETLDHYVGTYSFQTIMDIVIRRDGDQLSLQATGQDVLPIHAIGDALFSHPSTGILVEFKDDSFTLYQGRGTTVFTKATKPAE